MARHLGPWSWAEKPECWALVAEFLVSSKGVGGAPLQLRPDPLPSDARFGGPRRSAFPLGPSLPTCVKGGVVTVFLRCVQPLWEPVMVVLAPQQWQSTSTPLPCGHRGNRAGRPWLSAVGPMGLSLRPAAFASPSRGFWGLEV